MTDDPDLLRWLRRLPLAERVRLERAEAQANKADWARDMRFKRRATLAKKQGTLRLVVDNGETGKAG